MRASLLCAVPALRSRGTKLPSSWAHDQRLETAPLLRAQPWAGLAEAVLRPLPPDWRYSIEKAFSDFGEALGKILGGGQREGVRRLGRRGF